MDVSVVIFDFDDDHLTELLLRFINLLKNGKRNMQL